jgi:hypothetical protein
VRVHRQGDLNQLGAAAPAANGISAERFIGDALRNDANREILARLPDLGLPDAWLVAGCLFQSVWNTIGGRAPDAGIKDYDLFYFDDSNLSEAAEATVGEHVDAWFADLGVTIEAKNQARVHTWYPQWFGHAYPALKSTCDGIDRFLVPCTSVGLQVTPKHRMPRVYAPHGLADLYAGILRPNPLCDHRPLFLEKARSYQARWPWLQIHDN